MSVPGSNLLARAARLIKLQDVLLRTWVSSTTVAGVVVPVYTDPVAIKGSLQALSLKMYEEFGLDFQRDYLMFYTTTILRDLNRDATPDQVDIGASRYTVESNTNWQLMDGWRGSLLVRSGPVDL